MFIFPNLRAAICPAFSPPLCIQEELSISLGWNGDLHTLQGIKDMPIQNMLSWYIILS
jgi:hypothetical protein